MIWMIIGLIILCVLFLLLLVTALTSGDGSVRTNPKVWERNMLTKQRIEDE